MINVLKRNGNKEPLNLDKFHKVVADACQGLTNVSASLIELKSQIQFYDGIKTSDIQETLIKSASELISEETPNYQYVAGRLINYNLRKEVYGQYQPDDLYSHTKRNIDNGYYESQLLNWYSSEEYKYLDDMIDHERDFNIAYAGMEQFRGKYLIKNRVTGKIFETPQMAYMLIAMTCFHNYPEHIRLKYVVDFYNNISEFIISLPTPIMAGLRSQEKQFSSCVVIETDDSLDSIIATTGAIVKYISQKAGIGIGGGRIRAEKSPVRNGSVYSTGTVPFYRLFQAAVKSCSQGSVRNGAATLHYPIWHLEIDNLLVLKNNKGIEENRLRNMDYSVQFNKVFYERLISGENITLFSPNDVPEIYEAFFTNVDLFRKLYIEAEQNPSLRKKTVSAIELFATFIQERKDTGRIYLQNVDHANDHGAFIKEKAPVRMSNLCLAGNTMVTVQLENGDIKDMLLQEVIESTENYRIMSRNVKNGKDEFKKITAKAKTGTNGKVMRITDAHGNSVVCTPEHQIYTKNRGYIEAKDLLATDILQLLK